jgi:CRISPR/Cas system CSM-associated protein Csm2 small subunit
MAKYKFKLSEMSKTASPDDAEKELGTPKRKFEVGQVTYSNDGTTSSKITNIDPVTGAVSWKITQLPGFEKLYKEMDDLVDVSKRVYVKTKEDKKFREFYENARKLRNSIRTHLRNEYPDQYKRITRIGEGDMDEVSMSGAAGAYLTPYAFRRKGQKADDEAYKELGYKPVKENFSAGGRSLGYYEEDDVNEEIKLIRPSDNIVILKGDSGEYDGFVEDGEVSFSATYDDLDYRITDEYNESNIEDFLGRGHAFVELAKKYDYDWNIEPDLVGITIKLKDLNEIIDLVHVKEPDGTLYGTGSVVKVEKDKTWVRFDGNTIKKFDSDRVVPVQESQDPGASLGPGPKAGPDGVNDNYYVKAFKYKLVPKTKKGTYVQKGSGLEVKKLF